MHVQGPVKGPEEGSWRLGPLQRDRGAPLGRPQPTRSRLGASRGSPRRQSRAVEIHTQAQRSRGGGARLIGRPVGRRHRRARSTHATHPPRRAAAVSGGSNGHAAASSGRYDMRGRPAWALVAPSARPHLRTPLKRLSSTEHPPGSRTPLPPAVLEARTASGSDLRVRVGPTA